MCQLWAFSVKETEHLLKCSDARTNGDPVCRSLVIRREPMEENILGLVRQYAASMLKKERKYLPKDNVNTKRSILQNCKTEPTVDLGKDETL